MSSWSSYWLLLSGAVFLGVLSAFAQSNFEKASQLFVLCIFNGVTLTALGFDFFKTHQQTLLKAVWWSVWLIFGTLITHNVIRK
jgi:hypothetical protein